MGPSAIVAITILLNTVEGFQLTHPAIQISRNKVINSPKTHLFYTFEDGELGGDGDTVQRQQQQEEEDVILFSSNGEDEDISKDQSSPWKKNARWESLNPRVKLKIIEEQQKKAILKKKRKEPLQEKKRRLLQFYKETQIRKKRDSRVRRKIPFDSRTPLSSLDVGSDINGTVISLTDFGVYVDVGTECDGLLHVSQITRENFVAHPRQVFSPGDDVAVRISKVSPELKKLWLTMLPPSDDSGAMSSENDDDDDRILLSEIDIDDELWGEIVRVTDYGAYVDLGAVVDGFLHFMDHPDFGLERGAHPREYMSVGQRVRVWASDVDEERGRVKLTGVRPGRLPVFRREIRSS